MASGYIGSVRAPTSLQGKVDQETYNYLIDQHAAYDRLLADYAQLAKKVSDLSTKATSSNAPASPLGQTPSIINTAIGLNVTNAVNLTNHAIVLGSGSTTIKSGTLGTATTVLHGNASADPAYSAVALATDVSGILPIANGGTASATPSGTYTPTLTVTANITGTPTAYVSQYIQLGSVVIVSGRVTLVPTTVLTLTKLRISLPVASALASSQQCAGTAAASLDPALDQAAEILGDAANDEALLQFTAGSNASQDMFYIFQYLVV